jgi:putative membrane protein
MHDWGFHGWGMWLGWIIGLIIVIAIIVIVVKAVDRSGGNRNTSAGKSSFDILKERYASGEIDKEEFDRRKKDLM